MNNLENKNRYKNIVILADAGIGDFVWATSALSLIRQYDKNIEITLITCDKYVDLIDKSLNIDKIVTTSNKYHVNKNKFIRLFYKLFWSIKNFKNFYKKETCLILDVSMFFTVTAKYLYRIKNIIGPNNQRFGFNIKNPTAKYYSQIVNMPKNSDICHVALRYQFLIRSIFPTSNLALPILKDTKYLENSIKQKYLKYAKKYKIAISLRGSFPGKNWSIDSVKRLIELINKSYCDMTLFILGSSKQQQKDGDILQKCFASIDIRNLCDKTSLLELKEFLKHVDLVVSVDTGIVHLSAEVKTFVIALYGSALPENAMPLYHKSICLYKGASCSPCDEAKFYGKICNYPKCLQKITPEIVFEKVKEILN